MKVVNAEPLLSYIDRVTNSGLVKQKSLEDIQKWILKETYDIEQTTEIYSEFPPQIQISGLENCKIQIYPSQTKFYEQQTGD